MNSKFFNSSVDLLSSGVDKTAISISDFTELPFTLSIDFITPLSIKATVSQSYSISLNMCEETNTEVFLSLAIFFINSLNSMMPFGSRPLVGSSNISNLGFQLRLQLHSMLFPYYTEHL